MSRRSAGRGPDPYDGLLGVDKPTAWTSHDVVARIRGHFRLNKVGHGGTLDPMATGLLMILIGRGTKLSQQVMQSDKAYEGVFHLGVTTDTQDVDGRVLSEQDVSHISREQVAEAMNAWQGDVRQIPPMISAIKRDGVPLYKLARKGRTVERPARLIHVYAFNLLDFQPPRVFFNLRCTKGTYVRTLCADVGEALGCGAFLERLRRTHSGAFGLDRAHDLDNVLRWDRDALGAHLLPAYAAPAALAGNEETGQEDA